MRRRSQMDSVRDSWVVSRGKPHSGGFHQDWRIVILFTACRREWLNWFWFRQHVISGIEPSPVTVNMKSFNFMDALNTRKKYTHFRILVIGRANAGKTTLLKRVCNTTEEPCIYDEKNNNLVRLSPVWYTNHTANHSVITDRSEHRGNSGLPADLTPFSYFVRVSAGSTTSIVHSSLPATPNLSSMILQALRVEMNPRQSKFKTSLRNAPSPPKSMTSSMPFGQLIRSPSVICSLVGTGTVLSLTRQGFCWIQTRNSLKTEWREMVSNQLLFCGRTSTNL